MKPVAVVGPADAGRTTLAETLVERLGERGRVGTITHDESRSSSTNEHTGAAVAYDLGESGWSATGDSLTLADALDRLAEDCDYAVVDGASRLRVATIVLGDTDHAGRTIAEAPEADALDPDDLLESIESVEPHVTLGSLVAAVKRSPAADRAGAIATFTGRVRARDAADDAPTESLEFERYEGVAAERMASIRKDLTAREGVQEVLLHHRTGVIETGEDIVFVVVLAGHRAEAFRTVEDGIDRLKDEVPIFKKEVTTEDSFWVHERA